MKILFLALAVVLGAVMVKSIVESETTLAQTHATMALAVFNFVFIEFLFWDIWSDKPNLKIKMKDQVKIPGYRSNYKYALSVPVLNKGRKDAHNCSVSVQVFDRESGKKIEECSEQLSVLMHGATNSVTPHSILAFPGNFVARISAETHKSKASKIVEYEIRNGHDDPIIFKWGFVQYFRFYLKYLFKEYRNEWDTEFLANGLKIFPDPAIRKELIDKLGKMGDNKAVKPLIHCLENDPTDTVRDHAAMALGNIGDKQAVDPLLKCLQEDRADFGWYTSAIAKICDPECVKELINILHKTDKPQKQRKVAKSLGEIGEKIRDENIEKALIEALEYFNGDDLCEVVKALGKAGGEKALEQLKNMEQCCGDTLKGAIEQIQFRINVGGDNIEEK